MGFRIFILIAACLSLYFPLQANFWDHLTGRFKESYCHPVPTIRLLIARDKQRVNLEVQGKYSVFDPYENYYMGPRFKGKSRLVQALGEGLKWGEFFPGRYQIRIRPDDPTTLILIDGKEYKGDIYIYAIEGLVNIVNQVPIEDYVVARLIPFQSQPLEKETWAALAIAARTDAYFQAANPKNTYWAVDAEKTKLQSSVTSCSSRLAEAAYLTRYMVMSHTGIYEGVATPFAAHFEPCPFACKETQLAKISLQEANQLAAQGAHAAQILNKAFPHSVMMMMQYTK